MVGLRQQVWNALGTSNLPGTDDATGRARRLALRPEEDGALLLAAVGHHRLRQGSESRRLHCTRLRRVATRRLIMMSSQNLIRALTAFSIVVLTLMIYINVHAMNRDVAADVQNGALLRMLEQFVDPESPGGAGALVTEDDDKSIKGVEKMVSEMKNKLDAMQDELVSLSKRTAEMQALGASRASEEVTPLKATMKKAALPKPDNDEEFMSKELAVGGCIDDWSDHLWSGGKAIDKSDPPTSQITAKIQRIEMVVAYCHADLQWIRRAIANEFFKPVAIHLTIMSKCNNEADIPDFGRLSNVKVEVVQLPNKGGCDLAFVHFITRYLSRESPQQSSASSSSTALVFLKDTENVRPDGRLRSLDELVSLVLQRDDFVCSLEPQCWMSAYHDVKTLGGFMRNSYTRNGGGPEVGDLQFNPAGYRDLSDFVNRELNWTFPNDEAIQVCYGGQFAVTESRLFNGNRAAAGILFRRLEQLLMKGPAVMSVVEHFVERLWAGILAKPLTPSQVKEILILHEFVLDVQTGHMGPFASENIQGCCKIPGRKRKNPHWEYRHWGRLNSKAQEAAKLLGFNKEIWDSHSPVPIYSTVFEQLTHDKMKAVVYLGLRSYFSALDARALSDGEGRLAAADPSIGGPNDGTAARDGDSRPQRTLVVYSGPTSMDRLRDKNGMYHDNMAYFLEHAIDCSDRSDPHVLDANIESVEVQYVIVLTKEVADSYMAPGGALAKKMQQCGRSGDDEERPFIKVLTREDRCYDMESIRTVVTMIDVERMYDNIVFVNCGLVGPKFGPGSPRLVPSSETIDGKRHIDENHLVPFHHWSQLYTSRLTDSVRIVGHSINTHFKKTFSPHVQSFLYAIRTDIIPILLESGAIYDCGLDREELGRNPANRKELINKYEVGMSTQLLKRGYKIAAAFVNRYDFGKSLAYDTDTKLGTDLDDTVSDIWYESGIRNLTATMDGPPRVWWDRDESTLADGATSKKRWRNKNIRNGFLGNTPKAKTFEYHKWDILPWDYYVFFKVSRFVPEDVQREMKYDPDELRRFKVSVVSNDPRKSPSEYWRRRMEAEDHNIKVR